jgi:hypothetical protein
MLENPTSDIRDPAVPGVLPIVPYLSSSSHLHIGVYGGKVCDAGEATEQAIYEKPYNSCQFYPRPQDTSKSSGFHTYTKQRKPRYNFHINYINIYKLSYKFKSRAGA